MIRIDLIIKDDDVYSQIKDLTDKEEFITVTSVEDVGYSLSGEDIASFIALAIASGISYDTFRVYTGHFTQLIKSYYTLNKKSFKVTINGINFQVKKEEDIDKVLDALIQEYNLIK